MRNRKNIFIPFMALALGCGTAFADSESFCNELFPSNKFEGKERSENSKPSLASLLWKVFISPASMVEIKELKNDLQVIDERTGSRKKIAFLNLPEIELSSAEKEELKNLNDKRKNLRKDLNEIGFYKDIRQLESKSSCLEYVENNFQVAETLEAFEIIAPRFLELKSTQKEEKSYRQLKRKERFLKRKGWKVVKSKSFNEIHAIISEQKPQDVLMVGHAAKDGQIFDHQKNVFPATFFLGLGQVLENLVMYTCHSKEVMDFYQIESMSSQFAYFFPVPESGMEPLTGSNTPIKSLRSIRQIELSSFQSPEEASCEAISKTSTPSPQMGVYLNKKYIGPLGHKIKFPCRLLGNENVIEVYSTTQTRRTGSLYIEAFEIKTRLTIEPIFLKEYVSRSSGRHIVSRGSLTLNEFHP